ncbi:FAD-dependent oxidoreductase [Bacteroidota bacterium]
MNENLTSFDLLVVGAGIAGITTAVEAAETGLRVILVEKKPYIGGKVTQFSQYFPKLCPPSCGLEINIRRLRSNPNIKLLTMAEVKDITGVLGNYTANIRINPRYVNNQCTVCGDCVKVCPETRKNDFNYFLDETRSIYIPYEKAYPQKYIIDMNTCKKSDCKKCIEVCKYSAIDLEEEVKELNIETKSIIWATGWEPYDANKLDILGFGKIPDVITNVIMERLAAIDGPTIGKILRPSTKEDIKSIAFVQCAGSRDENHLEYCSSVCCLASLKQANYVREQYPDAEIHIYYIDIRSNGLNEDFYSKIQKDDKVYFHRGKVAKVFTDNSSGKLIIEAENSLTGDLIQNAVELVVLATGMEPQIKNLPINNLSIDDYGFLNTENNETIGCGVSTRPTDVASVVQDATGSVLKAIQTIKGK